MTPSGAKSVLASNSDANKVIQADRPIHDWYRFVLSYPPHLVRDYLNRFGIGEEGTVLDPFCGTGTTIVECAKLGILGVGVEANPMAHFACRVKTDWSPSPEGLLAHAKETAARVLDCFAEQGIWDHAPLPLFQAGLESVRDPVPDLLTLPPEKMKLLLAGCMSPLPLHKTLVLLEALDAVRDDRYYDHERLALAKAVVAGVSNLTFGPEIGVGPPREDAPVVGLWLSEVERMAEDLRSVPSRKSRAIVHHADSREIGRILEPESVDAVITSPPYPNEKDYTRTTRLESVLLGFIETKEQLRGFKKGLIRSNTRGVYTTDQDDAWVADNVEVQRIARAIEDRRIELGKTSGFERMYHRVTRLYFGGMARHLAELRPILRRGARLAYVVGDQASYLRVMIRTGQILAQLAESLGYEVEGVDLFRTRLATATREQLREEVVVLRWPGGPSASTPVRLFQEDGPFKS